MGFICKKKSAHSQEEYVVIFISEINISTPKKDLRYFHQNKTDDSLELDSLEWTSADPGDGDASNDGRAWAAVASCPEACAAPDSFTNCFRLHCRALSPVSVVS